MSGIDAIIAELEKDGAGTQLMSVINPNILNIICPILEQFEIADQMIALSACYAMVCATVEGEPVPMEAKTGMLIGFEERLRLHVAEIRAIYKEAYAFRSLPDCPHPIRRM